MNEDNTLADTYYKTVLPRAQTLVHQFISELGAEGREMKINYLKEQIQTAKHHLLYCHRTCADSSLSEETRAFTASSIPLLTAERSRLKKEIARVNNFKEGHRSGNEVTPDMIAQAKAYPIESLLPPNKRGFIPCLFHNEKTASMKVNRAENFTYCFGCHERADAIKIFMHLNNVSFLDAVRSLQ